jgi:hypothetical protein
VSHHLNVILGAAIDGYLTPVWSPCILAEANRVLTWMWLRKQLKARRATDKMIAITGMLESECSAKAKAWFGVTTNVFRVVDDRPPHEKLWSDEPRDPGDVPIWNAAVRSHAHFVVTSNLIDGPPIDETGRRTYNGVTFVSPDEFAVILGWWASICTTGEQPTADEPLPAGRTARAPRRTDTSAPLDIPPAFRSFLDELMAREEARLESPDD